ncbi:hypothetical protein H8959_005659, partial [Pygathrix nigripes]
SSWAGAQGSEVYCASDIYEAASRDAVAVARLLWSLPSWISEQGEGHHLQHVSHREMPEDLALESNPSDHPRASAIFLSKSQTDVREKRKSNHLNHVSPGQLTKNAVQLTAECATVTLVYLEGLLTYAEIDICPTNWKRIVLGTVLLASKVLDDQAVWTVDYCQILRDITVEDMNEMERHFSELLQFNINVPA